MTRFRHLVTLLLVAGLPACGVKTPVPETPPAKPAVPATDAAAPPPVPAPQALDIGDFEASLHISASIDSQSAGPNVSIEEMKDNQGQVLLTTAAVPAPFPAQFHVKFQMGYIRPIQQMPVAMRVKVYREKEVIGEFATFFDQGWRTTPFARTFDVLAGLGTVPPTMLVHAEAELIMLPPGTDTSKVDLKTADAPKEMKGVLLGCPLRINFGQQVATP